MNDFYYNAELDYGKLAKAWSANDAATREITSHWYQPPPTRRSIGESLYIVDI